MNVCELNKEETCEMFGDKSDLKVKEKSNSIDLNAEKISKKYWNCQPKI